MSENPPSPVRVAALRNTLVFAGGTYFIYILNIFQNILLARFLIPEDIGMYSLAYFLFSLLSIFRHWGFLNAVIHSKEPSDKVLPTYFFLETMMGSITFALTVIACGTFLRKFYPEKLLLVLACLALFSLFDSFSLSFRAVLEKNMQFQKVTRILVVKTVVSVAVAVFLAWRGFGVWSLVAGNTTGFLCLFLGLWGTRAWSARFGADFQILRFFFRFSFPLWIGGVMTFISFMFDDFLVGTLISIKTLGYYAIAYELSKLPSSFVSSVITRVAVPIYADTQDDKKNLESRANAVLKWIARGTIPLSILGFFTAKEVIFFALGEKWMPAVPLYQGLIVYSLCRPFIENAGGLLTALGKTVAAGKAMTLQAVFLLAFGPLCTLFYSITGLIACVDVMALLGVVYLLYWVRKTVNVSLRIFMTQGMSLIVCAAGGYAVQHFIHASPAWMFLLKAGVILTLYGFMVSFVEKTFWTDLRVLMSQKVSGSL